MVKIAEMVDEETLERLRAAGVVDEIALRDHQIREDFQAMRLERGARFAIYDLARRNYIGVKAVEKIVYRPKPTEK